jgi:transposase
MTGMKFVSKLLKFNGVRAVNVWFEGSGGGQIVVVAVKPHKTGCRCPLCGHRGKIVHTMKPRRWQDGRVCGRSVWLHYCPREIRCRTHGRHIEQIPWAVPSARVSSRFEYLLLRYCQWMPQVIAARMLGIAASTLSDLLHRVIDRERQGHQIRGLKTIGIDEISYAKGHKYATIVYDLERSRVVWVGRGKGRETIDRFFQHRLSDYQKAKIKWACCDMSEAYIGAIKAHCPQAQLVLDRFHVAKALNQAVDEVRKEQWREASGEDRKLLKGLRWILFHHSSTRSRQDNQTLKALEKANRRIYRAWQLKDEFEQFWNYKARWAAERFLKHWTTSALRSRLQPLRKFVGTVRKHADGIIAFIDTRLTNAVAEGLNRIIRMVKNRASGFATLDAFADMIYLCVGDLDIPAQIPPRFRTL